MAQIEYSVYDNTVDLYVSGLSTTWGGSVRTCNWFLSTSENPQTNTEYFAQTSIENGKSEGAYCSFSDLSWGTKYYCECTIWGTPPDSTNQLLTTLSCEFTTDEQEQTPTWAVNTVSLGTMQSYVSEITRKPFINQYEIQVYSIEFATSGFALFYTIGTEVDTYGYLTTSLDYDNETGKPLSYLAENDDGNGDGNFGISYEVETGVTYYVWVKSYNGSGMGGTEFHIEAPSYWVLNSDDYGLISGSQTVSMAINQYTLYRRAVSFETSGVAKFYTTGTFKVNLYLSATQDWNRASGRPSSQLATENNSNDGVNVSFSYNVEANTTYYIFIRGYDEEISDVTMLYIEAPATSSISSWDWRASNGNATKTATENAYNSIIYNGKVSDFLYVVWNDLVNKIKEARSFFGASYWATSDNNGNVYLSYEDTLMNNETESGRTLTADRFNAVRFNIGSKVSTGIDPILIQQDKEVIGNYFIKLTNALNTYIENG